MTGIYEIYIIIDARPSIATCANLILQTFAYSLDPDNILTTPYFQLTNQDFLEKHNFHEMSVMFLITKKNP